MSRHDLTDDQWDCINDLFPRPARTGRPSADRRRMVNAIMWILRTGAPWRDLPGEYGPFGTAWMWFDRWNSNGTLDKILHRLRASYIDSKQLDQDLWCVDGTVVRAARCAAGGEKKRLRRS